MKIFEIRFRACYAHVFLKFLQVYSDEVIIEVRVPREESENVING